LYFEHHDFVFNLINKLCAHYYQQLRIKVHLFVLLTPFFNRQRRKRAIVNLAEQLNSNGNTEEVHVMHHNIRYKIASVDFFFFLVFPIIRQQVTKVSGEKP